MYVYDMDDVGCMHYYLLCCSAIKKVFRRGGEIITISGDRRSNSLLSSNETVLCFTFVLLQSFILWPYTTAGYYIGYPFLCSLFKRGFPMVTGKPFQHDATCVPYHEQVSQMISKEEV